MKILYAHERFGSLAGAEANVLITATELGKAGHTMGILHGPSTGKNESAWNQTFSKRFPLSETGGSQITLEALNQFNPDVVYVHKIDNLEILSTLVSSGKPLVRMVHDHDIYCMRSYKYFYFSRKICTRPASPYCIFPCLSFLTRNRSGRLPIKFVSYSAKKREIDLNRRFNRMVVVTRYMRDELIQNGFNPAKIEIHAPVPRPGDPNLRSSFSSRNLIIFAGQIIRGKGVDILLQALKRVKEPFECIILGDGNHKSHCEQLCKELALDSKVFFKGFIPQEELKQYYRECSVIALTSVWPEPIATIGLEVMRYGLPVVAFDAGGIKDWLEDGHNGYLVPWMDINAFAQRIDELLHNKERAREMGANGLAFVSKHYDFDQYIKDLEHLFTSVIAENRHQHPNQK